MVKIFVNLRPAVSTYIYENNDLVPNSNRVKCSPSKYYNYYDKFLMQFNDVNLRNKYIATSYFTKFTFQIKLPTDIKLMNGKISDKID